MLTNYVRQFKTDEGSSSYWGYVGDKPKFSMKKNKFD